MSLTRTGVRDNVAYQLGKAPKKPPTVKQKIVEKVCNFVKSFTSSTPDVVEEDDEEDDDDLNHLKTKIREKDHLDGLFFMCRNR
tara:strand:+ start:82 stop:333 length:252 start_codon:yes stop_codon:yes gene_type:complete